MDKPASQENTYVPPSEYTGIISDESLAAKTFTPTPKESTTIQPTNTGNLFGQQNQLYAPIQYEAAQQQYKADPLQEALTKVAMLNANFRKCGYICYKYSLLVLALWRALHFVSSIIHFHVDDGFPVYMKLLSIVLTTFEIFQFAFLFNAMHRKNLSQANTGILMLKIYMAVYCLETLISVFLIRYGEIEIPVISDDIQFGPHELSGLLIAAFLIALVVYEVILGLLLLGATKVRDTLEKCQELVREGNYIPQA